MQVTQQLTRVQKKRAKMAAKKQAKEAGVPLPKRTKNYQKKKHFQPSLLVRGNGIRLKLDLKMTIQKH